MFGRYFELEISGYDSEWRPQWNRTEFGSNVIYHVIYVDVLYYVLCFALPLTSLAFMNWRVIIGYRAARRRRSRIITTVPATTQRTGGDRTRSAGGSSRSRMMSGKHENALTLVMITIVIVFIACQSPARLVQLVWGYVYSDCRQVTVDHLKKTDICIAPHSIRNSHPKRSLYGSHSFRTANTHTCLYLVSVHQMAPPVVIATI